MTLSTKRTFVGSYTVVRTKGFTCGVSSLKGWFGRGTIVVMRVDDVTGEIVKWPPVAKAWFRGSTRERRDWMHDYIAKALDDLGDKTVENIFGIDKPMGLYYAMEGTFSVAKARGLISKYTLDERLRIRPIRRH